jgi:hypothetical protein
MRQVEVRLTGWMIADAVAELRIWLDHNDCVPQSFEIRRLNSGLSASGSSSTRTLWPKPSSGNLRANGLWSAPPIARLSSPGL